MADLFGPDGVVRAVSVRPPASSNPSSADSWWADCVGGEAGTGTPIPAAVLNLIKATLASLVRGAGVAEDNTSDDMLKEAIRLISQDDKWNYAVSGGSAAVWTASPTPAFPAYVAGQRLSLLVTNANTGTFTLNVSGLGAKNVLWADGSAPKAGDAPVGSILDISYDGTSWLIKGLSPKQASALAGRPNITTYTSGSGNFTVPAGVTFLDVETVGAGGGGGYAASGGAAAGGAAGATVSGPLAVTPGQVIAYVVGAGGAGGVLATGGLNGADTTFGVWTAKGGTGASNAAANNVTNAVGTLAGSTGPIVDEGSPSDAGLLPGSGQVGGRGGTSYGGGYGGNGSRNGGTNGNPGSGAGAGGGGGTNGSNGGAGAAGRIRIRY
jgi:hypothetical protein